MRILWFSFSPYESHSFGQQTRITCRALAGLGYEVHVVGWRNKKPLHKTEGFSLHPCDFLPTEVPTHRYLSMFNHYIKSLDPDVIIFLDIDQRVKPLLNTETIKSRPFLVWTPWEWPDLSHIFIDSYLKKIPYCAFLAKHSFDLLHGYPGRSFLIHHGISPDEYFRLTESQRMNARRETGIAAKTFVIGSIFANLTARKGQTRLLEAFSHFSKGKEDVLLLLHTNPQEQKGLIFNDFGQKIAWAGDVLPKILFTGFAGVRAIDHSVINKYFYNIVDVNVLATAAEGWGLPVVEAMLAKVPTIMTDCTSAEELLGDDRGWRCRVSDHSYDLYGLEMLRSSLIDIDDLTAKMEYAYNNRTALKEYGQRAFSYAREHFTIDKTIKEFAQALEAIKREIPAKYPPRKPAK